MSSSNNLRPNNNSKNGKQQQQQGRQDRTSSAAPERKTRSAVPQPSPSGRRKLDFPAKDGKDVRPLKGKIFHLNVRREQAAKRLKEDLEYLGGTVDPFLNKDVWYLITDNAEAKKNKGVGKGGTQAPASPAMSTPSPFHQTKGSGGNADSPSMVGSHEAGPVTRGQKILQKAITSQSAGSSVLTTAKNLKIHIYHVDDIKKYIDREKERLHQKLGTRSTNKSRDSKDLSKPSTSTRERRLTRPFLKYEDASRHYRPMSKEFTSVPRVMTDTARGTCPFDLHPQRKENKEQRAERNCDEGEIAPNTVKKSRETQKTPSNRAHSSRKQVETGVKEKRRGYCECCAVKYDDLEKHLIGKQHLEFVRKQNNYVNLDRMITEGPNIQKFLEDVMKYRDTDKGQTEMITEGPDIEKFLEDVMKYHDTEKGQTEEVDQQIDEVLLVSSPACKSSKPPAATETKVTTKPKTTLFAVPKTPPKSPFKVPSPVKLPKRSPAKMSATQRQSSPRLDKLSCRQRTSPRLLASEPISPPPVTPTTASSICPFDKGKRESHIVPKKPPSSTVSSMVGVNKLRRQLSGDSPSIRGRRLSRQNSQVVDDDKLPGSAKQPDEQVDKDKAPESDISQSNASESRLRSRTKDSSKVIASSENANDTRTNKSVIIIDSEENITSTAEPVSKKHKADDVPTDILEEDDDVFEPSARKFRTPGRKPGNFSRVGDSKKSRTPNPGSVAGKVTEPDQDQNISEDVSPSGRPLRSRSRENKDKTDDGSVVSKGKRKRRSEDGSESNKPSSKKLRSKSKPDGNTDAEILLKPSPESSDEFKDGSQRRSRRTVVQEADRKQTKDGSLQRKQEQHGRKMNRKKQDNAALKHGVSKSNKTHDNSTLRTEDIDNVIREKVGLLTTSFISNTAPKQSTLDKCLANRMRVRDPQSENLLAIFRSEGSGPPDLAGFTNSEINRTHESFLNLSASRVDLGMEQKLEQAALTVCYIPSSELNVDDKSESSHNSDDLADISKVFQSLENFPSEGSDWEAPINNYLDKFEDAMEDLKRRSSELQALTPKSHHADDEGNSLKENIAQKEICNQVKFTSSEGNIADGIAEMPSLAAVDEVGSTRRRSARIHDKGSVGESRTTEVAELEQDFNEHSVPYVKSSGISSGASGIFKAPYPSPSKYPSLPGTSGRFITSTPLRKSSSLADDAGSPCIAIPPRALLEKGDEKIVEENYVQDDFDLEIDFPFYSSPNRTGVLLSPVNYVISNNGEIVTPTRKKKANRIKMSKEGFSYAVTPPSMQSEARKSLLGKMNRSASLEASSPAAHRMQSPTHSAFESSSQMNRSLSTPLSASSQNKFPKFSYYTNSTGQKRKRKPSFSMGNKKSNFSSSILNPENKGPKIKRRSRSKKGKSKAAKKSATTQNRREEAEEDVYEFVDEGLGDSQDSSRESPSSSKPNMVSVSIQTRPEDLESQPDAGSSYRLKIPTSPVKNRGLNQRLNPSDKLTLNSFNPVVDLSKSSDLVDLSKSSDLVKLPLEYFCKN